MPPVLSIVIVSWNTRELLRKCLESVQAESAALGAGRVETIVVDNASTDATPAMLRRAFPDVELIEPQRNLGFAAANNLGIGRAAGRYILLLNPDTEVHPGSLAILVGFMDSQPQAGAAGARLVNPDGSPQASASPTPTLLGEVWRLFHLGDFGRRASYPLQTWDYDKVYAVDVVQGASLLVRAEALEQVGLLDEGYFMYTEEVDLCYRLRKAGWGVFWVPRSTVLHYGGQSTRQASAEMFLRLYESKIRFFRKHRGRTVALAYKAILILAAVPRVLLGRMTGSGEAGAARIAPNYLQLLRALPSL
ncbi:MAG TPA: glycosyltransferase family 2 protein [Anaerolineales bacterium]|nr:glycosyltransferase family 2 protein [Anaerolineales bacterium]